MIELGGHAVHRAARHLAARVDGALVRVQAGERGQQAGVDVDEATREMGDTIRMSDIQLPKGVTASITDRDFVIATLKVSSAALSEINDEANSAEEA